MMSDDLKPNNCTVNFECTNPKKCVHYKKVKREPKPCNSCPHDGQCKAFVYKDYCFSLEQWKENQSMCQHSQDRYGECYNTIAQMQAITRHCKIMGVEFRSDGGCKDCKHINNPVARSCFLCLRLERRDYYTPKEKVNKK